MITPYKRYKKSGTITKDDYLSKLHQGDILTEDEYNQLTFIQKIEYRSLHPYIDSTNTTNKKIQANKPDDKVTANNKSNSIDIICNEENIYKGETLTGEELYEFLLAHSV